MWKKVLFLLFLFFRLEVNAQQFQLAPPQFIYSSVFFVDEMEVELAFAKDVTQIYYTLNGNIPSRKDTRYTTPIVIRNNITTITARVFSNDFLPSDLSTKTFVKQGIEIEEIRFSPPNSKYAGAGLNTLLDNEGGIPDHGSKTWLGYDQDTVVFNLKLKQKQSANSVLIHILENPGAWIVAPAEVEVFGIDMKTKKQILLTKKTIQPTVRDIVGCRILLIPFMETETEALVITIHTIKALPDWHPGKGKHGWFFVDEIKVY